MTHWTFKSIVTESLPGDTSHSPEQRQVHGACYSWASPKPTAEPTCIAVSDDLARMFKISKSEYSSSLFTKLFSGNHITNNMAPYAMCYGGHQFGHWAGQLGDGRAINLGEIILAKANAALEN